MPLIAGNTCPFVSCIFFSLRWFCYFCRRNSEVKKESQHKVPSVLISCVTLVSLVTWLLIPCLLCFIFTPLKYLIANLYEFHVDLIFQFFTDSLWCQHWSFLILVSHLSTSWGLEVSRRVGGYCGWWHHFWSCIGSPETRCCFTNDPRPCHKVPRRSIEDI